MVKVIIRKILIRHSLFPRHAQPSLLPVKETGFTLCLNKASQLSNTLISELELINRESLQLTRGFELRDTMASTDMTALMFQMMKHMQEQQLAANERQRQFMVAKLGRRADHTPAASRATIEMSPPITIDLKESSGEPEDWTTWSKVHRALLSALRCADALTETAGSEAKVNGDNFDRGSVDPERLRKAQ